MDAVAAVSPSVPGRQAVKFEVPGGGKRSESQPEKDTFTDGDRKFFGYSAFLDENFATDAQSWQVIWQLHDNGVNGSPPVALEVGEGRLWLATAGNDRDKDLGPVTPGSNVSVQLEVEFETGGGFVNVWRDGQQLVSNYTPPQGTTVDGGAYLKTGIYRDPSEGQDSTLFLNDLKIGDSLESVSDLAGATTAVSGAALPLLGLLLMMIPIAVLEVRRRRRARDPELRLPRPRPAFEPPFRTAPSPQASAGVRR